MEHQPVVLPVPCARRQRRNGAHYLAAHFFRPSSRMKENHGHDLKPRSGKAKYVPGR
jgi:hypothetical protein